MYQLVFSNRFKKNYKLVQKRGYDMGLLFNVFTQLKNTGNVYSKYKPHKLSGEFEGCWECHIKPDWLLIWSIDEQIKTITLHYTGTHSDLF